MKARSSHEMADDGPVMKLWMLRAKDVQEPPFHFTNVMHECVVAAKSAKEARSIAAGDAVPHGQVWLDAEMTECKELDPDGPGVIARKLS